MVTLVVALVGTFVVSRSGGRTDAEGTKRAGNHEMSEVLERQPSLASHRLALAFVTEKLAKDGGEASGEVVNGPAQEAYDQRAFPHTYIAPTQQQRARSAFGRARLRAATPSGRATLAKSAAAPTAPAWLPLGPNGGKVAAETTYTGTRSHRVGPHDEQVAIAGDGCTATSLHALPLGTAGGGLWRTASADGRATPGLEGPSARSIPSTAIGRSTSRRTVTFMSVPARSNGPRTTRQASGLYRSTDAGATFSKVPTSSNNKDVTADRGVVCRGGTPRIRSTSTSARRWRGTALRQSTAAVYPRRCGEGRRV